jgi:hypothetical protein
VRAATATRGWILAPVLAGLGAMVAVHLLLLHTYWDYSEGVYGLTAHEILHGADLYGTIVGAQPPGVFLVGAAIEAIHSGVEFLRFGVGLLQVVAGLICAAIVLRVSASRVAATAAAALTLLTPWAVHEHGALTPELVALPVMLGAARLAARSGRNAAVATGLLCGLLVLIKYPLAIPALVLVAVARERWWTAGTAALTLGAGLAVSWALGGSGYWTDTIIAQMHSGSRSLHALSGFWAQAGWNVIGLLVSALVAVALWRRAADRRQLLVAAALAAANLITFLSNVKEGTGLNIAVPVEASLVPLAVCGATFAVREFAVRRATAIVCLAGLAFTLAQSASLIASPTDAIPFERAFSAPAWEIALTAPEFEDLVANARRCPPGEPYGGPPLAALAAGRELPAGQADEFLPTHSPTLAAVARQIAAVHPVCSAAVPLTVRGTGAGL